MAGDEKPARRLLKAAIAAGLAAVLPVVGAFAAGSPIPELRPATRERADPPMRFLRVTSSDPSCGQNCPEWISAEGIIAAGSAAAFAKIIADLGGRRLPVLISSHGGSVRDALEMGELIRAKGLAVAVARTLFANCPERARACPDPRGQAIADGAVCASACPLILAGGVERLIGAAPLVGVHQMTTIVKETEGVERLTKTVKVYEQDWVDRTVETYLIRQGVGDPVMTLLRKTPAASIRWLSLDEIKASDLATGALDAAAPISAKGANGLQALAFDSGAPTSVLTAKAADEAGSGATLALAYRRGGGALEMALTESGDRPATGPADWTATAPAGFSLVLKADGNGPARALLPREAFCALGRQGRVEVEPSSSKPLAFDLSGAAVKALLVEACP